MPTQTLCGVLENGAGGDTIESAPWLVIEFLSSDFHRHGKITRHDGRVYSWRNVRADLKSRLYFSTPPL